MYFLFTLLASIIASVPGTVESDQVPVLPPDAPKSLPGAGSQQLLRQSMSQALSQVSVVTIVDFIVLEICDVQFQFPVFSGHFDQTP